MKFLTREQRVCACECVVVATFASIVECSHLFNCAMAKCTYITHLGWNVLRLFRSIFFFVSFFNVSLSLSLFLALPRRTVSFHSLWVYNNIWNSSGNELVIECTGRTIRRWVRERDKDRLKRFSQHMFVSVLWFQYEMCVLTSTTLQTHAVYMYVYVLFVQMRNRQRRRTVNFLYERLKWRRSNTKKNRKYEYYSINAVLIGL